MCGGIDQRESVTTMLGVMSCMYNDHPEDAALLVDLYARDCRSQGAEDGCVLSSLLNASVFVSLTLLGDEGKPRVDMLTRRWADECQT